MHGSSPRVIPDIRRLAAYIAKMRPQDILMPVPAGLCCKTGGFHIDPVRPVERAVITHGHSDHARAGHSAVLATQETLDIMRLRYGENFAGSTQAIAYGEEIKLGDVKVKFHPAGHVLGSAQVAVSCQDTCIVASGDYKDARDPTCAPLEVVRCDVFITEATFGLPVFRHGNAGDEVKKLLASVKLFPERAHLVGAYSLGKAQRVIALIREAGYDAPIYLHGAMEKITRYYESRGIALGELRLVSGATKQTLAGTITICPPSRPAGCGCARGRGNRACRCRWSSPITPTGTASPRPSPPPAPAKSGSPTARRTRWCTGAARAGSKRGRSTSSAMATRTMTRLAPPLWGRVGVGGREVTRRRRRLRVTSRPPPLTPPRQACTRARASAARVGEGKSHEPLRRASGPPRLRAGAQQQASADHRLFPLDAGSRAWLGARRADRRAEFP